MKIQARFYPILAAFLAFWPQSSRAVDETAANLIPEGKLSLSLIIDTLNHKYPKEKELFWNVSGIAFHDFTGTPQTDVIVGLAGYRDRGMTYNSGKQLVEDAGAGFAYFHLEKDKWDLKQVEVVEGRKYEGFEGANLMGGNGDQLVVYSSENDTKLANVFAIGGKGVFEKIAVIGGKGMGPRVSSDSGKPLMVDFQRALVNRCDDCGIFYGRPYDWDGKKFVERPDDFLDQVQSYDPLHSTEADSSKVLGFFENYLSSNPQDFCALANCFDLSTRLGLTDKAEDYRKRLTHLGNVSPQCKYCDDWLMNKNRATAKEYVDSLSGKKTSKNSQ
jgi:hypothetical protein